MYNLKESRLSELNIDYLLSNHDIKIKNEPSIRFSGESDEQSSHRTKVSIDVIFNINNNRLDFDLNENLIRLVLEKNNATEFYQTRLNISINATDSVLRNITFTENWNDNSKEPHKGIFLTTDFKLSNCRLNSLKISNNRNSNNFYLNNLKCEDLIIEKNRGKYFKAKGFKVKKLQLTPFENTPVLDNFKLNSLILSENIVDIELITGTINDKIETLPESYNHNNEKTLFKIYFVNLKNATETNIELIRSIKKQLEKVGNNYDYLNALACEYKITKKEIKIWKNPFDYLQLFLNEKSNNFGTSWSRAILFTFIVNLIGTSALLYSIKTSSCSGILNFDLNAKIKLIFFNNFSPIYNNKLIEQLNSTSLASYIIVFLTKIFIFYGIYQTVFAFRKYRN
ncbi:hypothetical protein PG913_08580 [Tenacibaculum pacificus]|uniref:hypothetical protein n=1 Tax=Tenacibaculum pacificus TaxID=3018314 RepID=UPI0022F3830E|nr:hypothetical protein [Tenacibaculum pacificus]WBX72954.1 hypothetical protein PG913_08580 [Tenacibaculum pacificus]